MSNKVSVIIVAAGSGKRFGGDIPKQFLTLRGKTVLELSYEAFEKNNKVDEIVVVASKDYKEYVEKLLERHDKFACVALGGKERQDSVRNGLSAVTGDIVLIHDSARPFVTDEVINRVIEETEKSGNAVPVVKPKDSIRTVDGNLNRDELYIIQTPQGFKRDLITESYKKAYEDGFFGTDEGGIIEHAGHRVSMVEGDYRNIKITTTDDMPKDSETSKPDGAQKMELRTGMGYDVHKLVEDRKCILMGVEIPYELGLLGHSDADVALHALMDAILGAAGMRDIGYHFPDTDDKFKGASSVELLKEVMRMITEAGYSVVNADVTIICQKPKVSPYIEEMRKKISPILGVDISCLNVKGTTTEKLGFTGRGEGIASQAICLLAKI